MPDVARVLKDEISRLARKEVRSRVDPLKKQVLDLRRRLRDAEILIGQLQSTQKAIDAVAHQRAAIEPGQDGNHGRPVRISAESVRKHRERLRLTQSEMAALLGVTAHTVLRWEKGHVSPRGESREAFAALRQMGVREVRERLEGLGEGSE